MKSIEEIEKYIKFADIFQKYGRNWDKITKSQNLPLDFIDEFFWQLKPFKVEKYQQLNPYILFKYQHSINWKLASKYQQIPQELIFINRSKVSWKDILNKQSVSLTFLEKNINFLKKEWVECSKLSENDKIFLINKCTK